MELFYNIFLYRIFYSIEVHLNIVNHYRVCLNHHLQSYFLDKYILLLTITVTFLCRTLVFSSFIATTHINVFFISFLLKLDKEIDVLLFFSLVTRILQLKLRHSCDTTDFQRHFFIYFFYINPIFLFFFIFYRSFELSLDLVQKNYFRSIQYLHMARTGIFLKCKTYCFCTDHTVAQYCVASILLQILCNLYHRNVFFLD